MLDTILFKLQIYVYNRYILFYSNDFQRHFSYFLKCWDIFQKFFFGEDFYHFKEYFFLKIRSSFKITFT